MALNLFKNKKPEIKPKKEAIVPMKEKEAAKPTEIPIISLAGQSVLKRFHVSEKASALLDMNRYTFRVARDANRKEIKKNVEAMFNVKVTEIRVLNMPEKSRTVGRHSGTRSGFKKAIVTLAEGNSITQVKP